MFDFTIEPLSFRSRERGVLTRGHKNQVSITIAQNFYGFDVLYRGRF